MSSPAPAAPQAGPWAAARRILLLIAHPDDEAVGCGAAIGRARAAGAQVLGLVLTTGIPPREALWPWARAGQPRRVARRRAEGRACAQRLGLAETEFLDVDGRCLRTVLGEAREGVLRAVARWQADCVWAPAYEGGHQDHDCANALAASLPADPRARHVRLFEYAEYHFGQGRTHSQEFLEPNGTETVLRLTAAEAEFKRQALAGYASAQGDLGYVRLEQEALRPLAAYDYSRPPHAGKLFYQRFQWVFFRHPRIDFTLPEEVCRALVAFGAAVKAGG